ncbi:MAG: ORF6N domain-containing protein [Prevotella sp.]|jgi:hypothetical protein|nr:ORF6N domain-containing protein [Prevotella sp.]
MNYFDIQKLIYELRGQRVMLDRDLAAIYGVQTKVLNQSVKRNIRRFEGDDFMFRLTKDESRQLALRSQVVTLESSVNIGALDDFYSSRSHFVTLNKGRGSNIKYQPYAFTELGVAMLSSVLNSETAISVNRDIMRAFVAFRHLATQPLPDSNADLRKEIQAIRDEMNDILADQNDINELTRAQLDAISEALAELQVKGKPNVPRRKIGFIQDDKE